MILGNHVLLSFIGATVVSKRFQLDFFKVALIFFAANLIDYDHLLYFSLDDGRANSLSLHPLHIYSSVIFMTIVAWTLYSPAFMTWGFCCVAAICLHLVADVIAFSHGYSELGVYITCGILFILSGYVAKTYIKPYKLLLTLLYTQFLLCSLYVFITIVVLELAPQKYYWYWLVLPSITAIFCLAFYRCFRNKSLTVI